MIKKFILNIWLKINFNIKIFMFSLHNVENDILKYTSNIYDDSNKIIYRFIHRNKVIENFYKGLRDEKYNKYYYDILKKADKFMNESSTLKLKISADKYAKSFGNDNEEHFGFYDEKHKYFNKTLKETINLELEDRRTKDDNYKLIKIFNENISNTLNDIDISDINNVQLNIKPKPFINVIRDNEDIINKIEDITEILHVKHIGFEKVQLEFFIPLKFKINFVEEDSEIFFELSKINNIFVTDNYGEKYWYKINKFKKRIRHNIYEVWKFDADIMEVL